MAEREYRWAEVYGTVMDPDTGMPEVPKGYFWRVKPGGMYKLKVELRQRWFWGISFEVEMCVTDDATEWGVRNNAAYILNRWQERTRKATGKGVEALLGDYPPKKLGNN